MKINKDEFLRVLDIINPGVANVGTVLSTECFSFNKEKVYSFNGSFMICTDFKTDIKAALPAKELFSVLSKTKQKEIIIETKKEEVVFKMGKAKAGLKIKEPLGFSEFSFLENPQKHSISDDLIHGMYFCSLGAGKDYSKPVSTCIHLNDNTIESTNTQQAFVWKTEKTGLNATNNILIPANIVKHIKDLDSKEKIKHISLKDSWVSFHTDNSIFSVLTLSGDFYDIKKVMDFDGNEVKFPDEIEKSIMQAATFNTDDEIFVSIAMRKNLMLVKGQGELGWFLDKIKTDYTGESFTFQAKADFLLKALKETKNESFKCIINKEKKMIKFITDKWQQVFLLVMDND